MADNVTANPGSGGAVFTTAGLSFSGDSAQMPIGSGGILSGSEGSWSFSLLVGGAGAVTAGTQRTTLASDDPAVTSLAVIDDWDESDRAKVNLIVGQAGIAAGAGAVGVTVPRVTLGSDDPAVTSLSSINSKITAVNTGAVVVSSSALPSGASTAANQSTANTSLSSIDGKITACNTGSVTIGAALPAGTNAIGKLASNAGVTIGAVEIASAQTLGTVTTVTTVSTLSGGGVAHDGVDSGNPHKIGGRAVSSLASATLVAAADRTDAVFDLDGAMLVRLNRPMGDSISERVSNTDGASTAFSNFGAVASTRNVITTIVVYNSSATAGYVDFRDGTGGSVLWTMPIPAGGGSVLSHSNALFRTSANTALAYDVSAALSTVYISVSGFQSKV